MQAIYPNQIMSFMISQSQFRRIPLNLRNHSVFPVVTSYHGISPDVRARGGLRGLGKVD
jgi:hypothetical protein